MSETDNDQTPLIEGIIFKFDLVRNSGTIFDAEGNEYTFHAKDFAGKIPDLLNKPGVSFEVNDGAAKNVIYNPNVVAAAGKPRRGLAFLGAAKCPNCHWRIPMIPSANEASLRRGKAAACPECGKLLSLKSMFRGVHNYLAAGIWVGPFIARQVVGRVAYGVDDQTKMIIGVSSIFLYFFQILSFFYLYIQERLVIIKEVEVFDED